MDAESIVYLMNFNSQAMGLNLDGLTHEDSLVQPPSGNCINWMLGHLLVHRHRMLETLGEPAPIPEALMRYDRGRRPPHSARRRRLRRTSVILAAGTEKRGPR